ncbi:hypothetical protein BTJ35_02115 [Lactobacillus delbrueckii subsp. bulgaricus]|uniref:hypothetical protein n=1 Tax=Lactobacillus delbrueckii TaxID=1584 RepID=UPI000760B8FC|nr:hypothetical protein [Lactobacillus delbrueckii]APV47607.1 hypothetical protein LB080_06410 [Lactobacillus delbrueckii subsp. bulgaricus]AYC67200.1 hypothetical protein D4Z81_08480 [Lactobacillus delbrueckii subsp. bulgaricus]MBT8940939.1 hypothetical protein [Lactobacillus delbrueckii subsp. bulgaricus]MBT9088298.1 hypothetical protein [Lactobacillus delbrueckii subsp. bulgaricus]MBT9089940.1 hypothetical protein [Lactobacillus delbrueckii subsp. bulgaricus]
MIVGIGRIKLKKRLAFSAAFMAIACLFKAGQPVAAASEKLSTKVIDGKKNYGIYSSLKQVRSRLARARRKRPSWSGSLARRWPLRKN